MPINTGHWICMLLRLCNENSWEFGFRICNISVFNNFAIYNFFTVGNYYHKKREWGAALIPNYMKSEKCVGANVWCLGKFAKIQRLKDHRVRQFGFSDAGMDLIYKMKNISAYHGESDGAWSDPGIITLSWDGIGPQVITIVIIPSSLYNKHSNLNLLRISNTHSVLSQSLARQVRIFIGSLSKS